MRGDAHSGKHSERNTVYELEITTMNAALAPSFFILGADVRRFTEANIEKTRGGGGVKRVSTAYEPRL